LFYYNNQYVSEDKPSIAAGMGLVLLFVCTNKGIYSSDDAQKWCVLGYFTTLELEERGFICG